MYGNPSYFSMNIHHFATVFSILFSYFTNYEIYGVLVLFLSDVSDCLLNIAKTMRDLQLFGGGYNNHIFAVMFPTWVYTRAIFLPICFFQSSKKFAHITPPDWIKGNPQDVEMFVSARFGILFTIFNVYSIVVLNFFWTYLMCGLLYDKLFKGGGYHSSYEGDSF